MSIAECFSVALLELEGRGLHIVRAGGQSKATWPTSDGRDGSGSRGFKILGLPRTASICYRGWWFLP